MNCVVRARCRDAVRQFSQLTAAAQQSEALHEKQFSMRITISHNTVSTWLVLEQRGKTKYFNYGFPSHQQQATKLSVQNISAVQCSGVW